MKKILKLAAIVAGITTVLFASCSNLSSDATVSDDTSVFGSKSITLTARADENTLVFPTSGNSSARTILPDSVDGTSLDFFLAWKTLKETAWTVKKTTFTASDADKTVGTITETFDLNSYEFKLYAVPAGVVTDAEPAEATVKNAAVLAGYATADLRYNDAVAFTLTANNMTGKGCLDIAIKTVDGFKIPDGYTVTAGLYDFDTSSNLKWPTSTPAPITVTAGVVDDTTSFKVSTKSIDAGSYNLVVKLTNTNITPSKVYTFSEKVIVLVNQTSTGTVWIRDIIDYAPTQPADFIAGFSDPVSSDSNYYTVEFAWTDTSDCETGFELELMKVDNKTDIVYPLMPTKDDDWGDTAKTKGFAATLGVDIATSSPSYWDDITDADVLLLNKTNISLCPLFVSYSGSATSNVGSLNMNQSHLQMILPMDHRFIARIRAVNDVGPSPYTYLDLHKAPASGDYASTAGCTKDGDDITINGVTFKATQTTAAYTLTKKNFEDDVTTINRYKIKYDLNDGTYVDADGTLAAAKMPALVLYESQHNTDATTASANADKVVIIYPNSVKEDTAAGISAVPGDANTYIDTTGAEQTGVHLELKNSDGFYWQKWMQEDINGEPYVTSNTAPIDYAPPKYKGYTSLYLIAAYNTEKEVTADVNFADMTRYELNKGFFTVSLKSGVTDKTSDYLADANTLIQDDGTGDGTVDNIITLADASDPLVIPDTIDGIVLSLNANAKYTDDGGTDHAIKYDKLHLRIEKIENDATKYDKDSTSGTFEVKLTGYTYGKYMFILTATKGTYTYAITQVVRITQ